MTFNISLLLSFTPILGLLILSAFFSGSETALTGASKAKLTGLKEKGSKKAHNALKLKENNIDSKVVSMPCMELFEKQSENYKKDIFNENAIVFTFEAGSVSSWQKYKGNKGYCFGIDKFGESAPYKKIFEYFNLTEDKILNIIQKHLRK